jgi:uncharacterized protein YndB with AHSA1/START domain
MTKPIYTATPGSREMLITLTYDAPRELVYKLYTDPQHIPDWWGPRNLVTTVESMELKTGGYWRYIQRDQQNNVFGFHGVYHSIEPNRRIISTFEWEGNPGHVILVTTSFEEQDGQTIIHEQDIFQSVEDRDGMINTGMEQGLNEGDERFKELLAGIQARGEMQHPASHAGGNGRSIKITRIFDATPEQVWQEWTNPDMYMCWWGPRDYFTPYARFDLRVGGKYLSAMRGPDGKDIWSTGTYKEIVEPNRIVMTDSFADEQGNVVPPSYYGMGPDMPVELEVELTLEDLDGKTRLALEHCGLPEGAIQEQTREGWNESFDKLAGCLR